jgi:putative ABC transport system permease protein
MKLIFKISWANICYNKYKSLANIFVLALGIFLILSLLQIERALNNKFLDNLKNIDLVVGAKGSPLQIILSSVLHIDFPTGNISSKDANKIYRNPKIKNAIPISLGDMVDKFRIVGTDHKFLSLYNAEFEMGEIWQKPFEIVIGYDVAKSLSLKLGDRFFGNHGLVEGGETHKDQSYIVKGILKKTGLVIDRLAITSTESIWEIHSSDGHENHHHEQKDHKHSKEVTAILVQYKSPLNAISLPREINSNTNLQAASPAMELARIREIFGVTSTSIKAFFLLFLLAHN